MEVPASRNTAKYIVFSFKLFSPNSIDLPILETCVEQLYFVHRSQNFDLEDGCSESEMKSLSLSLCSVDWKISAWQNAFSSCDLFSMHNGQSEFGSIRMLMTSGQTFSPHGSRWWWSSGQAHRPSTPTMRARILLISTSFIFYCIDILYEKLKDCPFENLNNSKGLVFLRRTHLRLICLHNFVIWARFEPTTFLQWISLPYCVKLLNIFLPDFNWQS